MSNEAAVAVFVRAFGILKLVGLSQAFLFVLTTPGMRDHILDGDTRALAGLYFEVLWLAIYAAMIVVPMGFARLLVPKKLHGPVESNWTPKELESVVLSVLGVFLVLSVLMDAGEWLADGLSEWIELPYAQYAFSMRWQSVSGGVVTLLVGLSLVFGFKAIGYWLHCVRTTGQR